MYIPDDFNWFSHWAAPILNFLQSILLRGSTPFIRLIYLGLVIYLIVKAIQALLKRAHKTGPFRLDQEAVNALGKPTVADHLALGAGFLGLLVGSIVILGLVNLFIHLCYTGGVEFAQYGTPTAHSWTNVHDELTLGSIVLMVVMVLVFFVKMIHILPGLFKVLINLRPALAYHRTTLMSFLSVCYLGVLAAFQIANDHDVYFHLSILSVWLWFCGVLTFLMAFTFIHGEIERLEKRNPLSTVIDYLMKQFQEGLPSKSAGL